jgi:hypothetical protein
VGQWRKALSLARPRPQHPARHQPALPAVSRRSRAPWACVLSAATCDVRTSCACATSAFAPAAASCVVAVAAHPRGGAPRRDELATSLHTSSSARSNLSLVARVAVRRGVQTGPSRGPRGPGCGRAGGRGGWSCLRSRCSRQSLMLGEHRGPWTREQREG